jgi:hypothetical protein
VPEFKTESFSMPGVAKLLTQKTRVFQMYCVSLGMSLIGLGIKARVLVGKMAETSSNLGCATAAFVL